MDQPRDAAVPGGDSGRAGRCLGSSNSGLGRAGLDCSRAPVVWGLRTARARGVSLRLRRRARPLSGAPALDASHPLSRRSLCRMGGLKRLLRFVPRALDSTRASNHARGRPPRRSECRSSAHRPADRELARLAPGGSGLCSATLAFEGFATGDPCSGLGGPGVPALPPLERIPLGSSRREPVAAITPHPTSERHRGVRRLLPGVLEQSSPGRGLPQHGPSSGIALELDCGSPTTTAGDIDGHGLGVLGSHGLPPPGAPSQPRDRPPGSRSALSAADPSMGSRRTRAHLCQD